MSLEEIARSAGVGIGTLYRNFPRGKEQLVSDALVEPILALRDKLQSLRAEENALHTHANQLRSQQATIAGLLAERISTRLPGRTP